MADSGINLIMPRYVPTNLISLSGLFALSRQELLFAGEDSSLVHKTRWGFPDVMVFVMAISNAERIKWISGPPTTATERERLLAPHRGTMPQ